MAQPMLDATGQPLPLFGFLNAHDAFRRDLPRFAAAASRWGREQLDDDGLDALRHHWSVYRTLLEQHHTFEDEAMFRMVAAHEPSLKGLVDELAAQHDELHELLPRISALLLDDDGEPDRLAVAFEALADLLVPHFASEEEHLVPVARRVIAAGPGGPPPRQGAAEEEPVADEDAVPFALEHLDAALRTRVLPLFPSRPDPARVEGWLADHRARVARWAG